MHVRNLEIDITRDAPLCLKIPAASFQVTVMGYSVGYFLNFASAKFAGDARNQARSRTSLLQALDNEADPVKSALPKGKQS
jgi:hypothetical protein